MKWKTIVVLGLVALAGCGGGDDDSSDGASNDGGAASTGPATPEREPIKGEYTEAKVLKALGIEKTGATYKWGNCEVAAVAWTKDDVKNLKGEAGAKAVQTNKSGTVGVQVSTQSLTCALQADALLKTIP
jgi:hypothetical protein